MVCPACVAGGFLGGAFGSFLGIHPPNSRTMKVISIATSATLAAITAIALKTMGYFSYCPCTSGFVMPLLSFSAVVIASGVVYSIAINYLIQRISSPSAAAS